MTWQAKVPGHEEGWCSYASSPSWWAADDVAEHYAVGFCDEDGRPGTVEVCVRRLGDDGGIVEPETRWRVRVVVTHKAEDVDQVDTEPA